jgi:hypothetical protein
MTLALAAATRAALACHRLPERAQVMCRSMGGVAL